MDRSVELLLLLRHDPRQELLLLLWDDPRQELLLLDPPILSRARPLPNDRFKTPEVLNKRVDLPPEAYIVSGFQPEFAARPGMSNSGKPITVQVNQFAVTQLTNPDVFTYDISLSPLPLKPIVFKKVWNSRTFQGKLKEYNQHCWIYDDHKLAWSMNNVREIKIMVDLDAEKGRTLPPGAIAKNSFLIHVRQTGKVRMDALRAYLQKQMTWDNSVIECMSFLDHVLRQGPSERMTLIKRSLFNNNSQARNLNSYIEAIKGIYSSIRLNETITKPRGTGLGVNVDVTNQCFWIGQKFEQLVRNYLINNGFKVSSETLKNALRPVQVNGRWSQSEPFKALRKLQKIRFEVNHRGKTQDRKEYIVKRFAFDEKYGDKGANATVVEFEQRMPDGTTQVTTVQKYYFTKYKARLQEPYLPLIETNRDGMFPFEVCEVHRFNRYPFKLDPNQTSEMIKFAVQRPIQRKAEIEKMVSNLDWGRDRYLNSFGITISTEMSKVPAKLIMNPEVEFGNKKKVNPRFTGRWDLRNSTFVAPHRTPLKSWAFCILENCVDLATVRNFASEWSKAWKGHGGQVANMPNIFQPPSGTQHGDIVTKCYKDTGGTFKMNPQVIFFIVPTKTTWVYERLKKNADCRYAFTSQVLLAGHVQKAQGQYCSNVCLKVNAKLGGQNSKIAATLPSWKTKRQQQAKPSANDKGNWASSVFFDKKTMMIGVDVSHAAPGSDQASMAAMCVSMDKDAAIYRGAVQTNGWRVEVLTPTNTNGMLAPILQDWIKENGSPPEQVFYFRDGVSEGQFAHVMEYELTEMKNVFKRVTGKIPKFTVIIATKRHHIRFFPGKDGDRNENALPGTCVEKEVTHPFHYDFYLCSHSAIQGTARPVHYNVIHDDIKLSPDDLQQMIYHQCYQYCRSTTPVSLHPAVYYAHLAGARARAHENLAASAQRDLDGKAFVLGTGGVLAKHDPSLTSSQMARETECLPLLPLGGKDARPDQAAVFRNSMWWV
ncbi:Piwi domain-containing protein [Bombardia bombarda]|uniref:Piwi domain-containing protein n=1 Tax=Bombardia bombarda TaxID=252184 RepID=A0AA39X108_9PEZI|nr:Piwi domain-containing protein [Bombardia bombarda]